MKEEDKILERFGRSGGWKVPAGYFEDFATRMAAGLPEYPKAPAAAPMTRWQRLKPYVYLAAMFAGIWMMMQVFHRVSGMESLNIENPPEQIAQIMSSTPESVGDMLLPEAFDEMEMEREVSEAYDNIAEFEKDFGYELEPEYARIEL